MNMNSAPEEFDQLRRLLALKRHEQPPPGYFNMLPRRVIARLEAAQSVGPVSWFEKWVQVLQLRPRLAGGFGVGVFGLLLAGLVVFQKLDQTPMAIGPAANEPRAMIPAANDDVAFNQIPTGDVLQSSINPVLNPQLPSALFDGFRLNVRPVADQR